MLPGKLQLKTKIMDMYLLHSVSNIIRLLTLFVMNFPNSSQDTCCKLFPAQNLQKIQPHLSQFYTNKTYQYYIKMNNQYIRGVGQKTIPLYGTTVYIGQVPLETVYGTFVTKTFQDIIHKGYIVSLVFGDLKASPLYIRMHSSCITSQCLRSMDCDCVEQLEGALQKISQKGSGILFYLMQQGRGSGYVAKSRDRMLVQHVQGTDKEITTFQAYEQMGMKKDYRDYRNIKDICHILNILDKEFVLITNNPDKISGFKNQGMNLNRIQSIDIPPSPFNIAYLKSKQQSGHLIFETKKKQSSFYHIPYERMKPFEPFALKDLQRFILVSTYYLPIKPIGGELYFNEKDFKLIMDQIQPEDKAQLKIELVGSRYFVKFPRIEMIKKYGELTVKPWWFKAHVFYDVGHSTDYIVLTHQMDVDDPNGPEPIVRIQSESIFDRFPLKKKQYKQRYKQTLKSIVRRGKGLIMILYNDGRGTGLGHRILDMQGIQSGISPENRDFDAVSRLLKVFVADKPFQLFGGLTSYRALMLSMANNGLNPSSYTLFAKGTSVFNKITENKGIESLGSRINNLPRYLEEINQQLSRTQFPNFAENDVVFTTGIGTSQAHARFLSYIIPKFKFKAIEEIGEQASIQNIHVILFSQGLSPNISMVVEKCNIQKLVIVTTIHKEAARKDRIATLKRLEEDGAKFIIYKEELPDNTLVRVQGPAAGYLVCLHWKNSIDKTPIKYTPRYQKPSQGLIKEFINKKQVLFVIPSPLLPLSGNISMKFLQGAFSEPAVFCDQISFSHGYFQYALNKKIPIVFVGDVKKIFKNFVEKNCLSQKLETNGLLTLLDLQIFSNYLMLQYIEHYQVDQINWEGKQKDKAMYDVRKFSDL